jgi:hypothetical protein
MHGFAKFGLSTNIHGEEKVSWSYALHLLYYMTLKFYGRLYRDWRIEVSLVRSLLFVACQK